ncbi:hypothetical protein GCM10010964_14740 [Caldovatus sediminis]|uniref:Uncharacterized protein n=1 Tax=Caldovatus sediminis TaxID=2041189 RepID=A0A8J2ZA72_9PROT|nr:hypothetical protein [Caldovatus sediminis]GGG27852.1 hypothetical protein GCM10010964_14740 [Caldovatus sediminis]
MRHKDWTVAKNRSEAQARHRTDATLRLLLFGEKAARALFATALIATTAALCAVALMGPDVLASTRAEALPSMWSRLRLALSGMFG